MKKPIRKTVKHVCPPHEHRGFCNGCVEFGKDYAKRFPVGIELPNPPHEHNSTRCQGCFQMFLDGEKSPNVTKPIIVQCKHPDPEVKVVYRNHWSWYALTGFMLIWGFIGWELANKTVEKPYPVYITKWKTVEIGPIKTAQLQMKYDECHADYCADHPRLKACRP